MKFCLAHFRWEIWVDGLCYAWLTGEADEDDREKFWTHFVTKVHQRGIEGVPVLPLDPQPEGCRFDTGIRERATA